MTRIGGSVNGPWKPWLSDVKSYCRARGVEMVHHRVSTLSADLVLEYMRGVSHSEQLLLAKTISELDVEGGWGNCGRLSSVVKSVTLYSAYLDTPQNTIKSTRIV